MEFAYDMSNFIIDVKTVICEEKLYFMALYLPHLELKSSFGFSAKEQSHLNFWLAIKLRSNLLECWFWSLNMENM